MDYFKKDFLSNIADLLPPLKMPKLKKWRKWNGGSLINLSQITNNFHNWKGNSNSTAPDNRDNNLAHQIPPKNSTLNTFQSVQYPSGISTISSSVVELSPSRRDNCGLYALKCDRNAAKRGILLNLPKQISQRVSIPHDSGGASVRNVAPSRNVEMKHEKFSPCKKRPPNAPLSRLPVPLNRQDTYDDDVESETSARNEVPPPPRRQKRKKRRSPAPPITPAGQLADANEVNPVKNRSELFRISDTSNRPHRSPAKTHEKRLGLKFPKLGKFKKDKRSESAGSGGSVDIFNKEPDFNEFDTIFKNRKEKMKKSVQVNDRVTFIKSQRQDSVATASENGEETETCDMYASDDEKIKTKIKTQDFYSKKMQRCWNVSSSPISERERKVSLPVQVSRLSPDPTTQQDIERRSPSPSAAYTSPSFRAHRIQSISGSLSLSDQQCASLELKYAREDAIDDMPTANPVSMSNVQRKILYYSDEDMTSNGNNTAERSHRNQNTNDNNNNVNPNPDDNDEDDYYYKSVREPVPIKTNPHLNRNVKRAQNHKVITLRRSINSNEYYEEDEEDDYDIDDALDERRVADGNHNVVAERGRSYLSIKRNNSADEGIYI